MMMILLKITHLLKQSVPIFRSKVVNSVFAIWDFTDGKLANSNVRLILVNFSNLYHVFSDQITIGSRQSWHLAFARGHSHGMPIGNILKLSGFKKHHLINFIEVFSIVFMF